MLEKFGIELEKLVIDEKEFIDRLPIHMGKIIFAEIVDEKDFKGNDVKNLIIYILNKETKTIQIQRMKISNSKKSKYYRFIKALNKTKPISSMKEILGAVYKWKWDIKEYNIGGDIIESGLYVPEVFIEKEPITSDEINNVQELKRKIDEKRKERELANRITF